MKDVISFLGIASMFVLVKSVIRNTYRNPRAIIIAMLGAMPLSALVGLTIWEETERLYLSYLSTSITALIAEHLLAAIIDYGEKHSGEIVKKLLGKK